MLYPNVAITHIPPPIKLTNEHVMLYNEIKNKKYDNDTLWFEVELCVGIFLGSHSLYENLG